VGPEEPAAVVPPREVMRMEVAQQVQRAWLPIRIYPISAGVKGGLAGGVAMAILAMIYGVAITTVSGTRLTCWPALCTLPLQLLRWKR